jgi:hypothetical protein
VIPMQIGDFAKYRNTGTVGKVMDIMDRPEGQWVLLDTYDLYYDASTLESASEFDYKVRHLEEQSLDQQMEQVDRLKEQIEESMSNISRITASGT